MKILIILLLISSAIQAQDLQKYQWKNRLIIVSSPDFKNEKAVLQLAYLKENLKAIADRKLKIINITNSGYTEDFSSEIKMLNKTNSQITAFHIVLIGLDGSEKYRNTSPVPNSTFFGLIDQMPMRKREIRKSE